MSISGHRQNTLSPPKQIEIIYEAAETTNHSESTEKQSQVSFLQTENHNHQFVPHNHHDYSLEVPDSSDVEFLKKKANYFPLKLHRLLDEIESDGLAHVISWQPHGRSLAVHKPKEFVDIVMPKYFRQTKLSSFQRQLNLYGFLRFSRGRDRGAYYHEMFLRGRPFLCKKIIRTTVKGTGVRTPNNPSMEPNLYAMKYLLKVNEIKKNEKEVAMIDVKNDNEEKIDIKEDCVMRDVDEKLNDCHVSNEMRIAPTLPMKAILKCVQQTGVITRTNDVLFGKDDEEGKENYSRNKKEKKNIPVVPSDSSSDDETVATEEGSSYSSLDEVFNGSLDDLLIDSSGSSFDFDTDSGFSLVSSEEENASMQLPSLTSKMDKVIDDLLDNILANTDILFDIDDILDNGIKLGCMLDKVIETI